MLGFRKPGFKSTAWPAIQAGIIPLIGIMLLAACQLKTPPPTPAGSFGTEAASSTASEATAAQPTAQTTRAPGAAPTQPASNAYPNPPGPYPNPANGPAPTTAGAYPAPGSVAGPTQASLGPYPDPANNPAGINPTPVAQSAANNPYPSPGASPYPGPPTQAATAMPLAPTGAITPTPNPTAASGSAVTPAAPPSASPTATLPMTAAPTPTPTATPVLSLWTDLLATDPSTVKLASGKPELVVFFAYWDGNSRIMMPAWLNLQDQYGRQVNFIYLDQDDPATAELKHALYYKAYAELPQIFLLGVDGKVLRKWQGVVPQLALQQALEAALGG